MFTPAITLPSSLELLTPDARAKPGESERVAAITYQRVLQYGGDTQIGGWGANKYSQLDHYRGIPALAIKPFLNATRAAKFNVFRRKDNPRDGVVAKSLPSGHWSQDDEYEPLDPDHPLCQIIARPNGEHGKWSMSREAAYLTLQFMLTGDAPAWCVPNAQGKPVQFYALSGATVQLQFAAGVNPQYPKGAYRITPYAGMNAFGMAGGLYAGAILPAEEIARLIDEDPYMRGAGRSRLQVGAQEIDVLDSITRSRHSYFGQGTQLDTVVYMPGVALDIVQDLQEAIRQKHGGADNHGNRLLILGGGTEVSKATIQPISQTATEMGFLESFEQAAAVVGAFFGVPKPMMNLTDSSSYATLYAAKQQFYELGLIPYFLRMSDFLTVALADPWSEYPGELKIEVEPPPLGDKEMEKSEREFAFQNDAITVNAYLRETGRKPVPDGDVPLSVYRAKGQQQFAPPPQPQALPQNAMNGMPGTQQPGQEQTLPGATQPVPGQAQQPTPSLEVGADGAPQPGDPTATDDSPEATQDAVTQAALASLGLGDEEQTAEQPPVGEVQKAVKRQEGAVWTGGDGRKWTKTNGRIVPYTEKKPPQMADVDYTKPMGPGANRRAYDARVKRGEKLAAYEDSVDYAKPMGPGGPVPTVQPKPGTAKSAAPATSPAPAALDRAKTIAAIANNPGVIRQYGFTEQGLSQLTEPALKIVAAHLGVIPVSQAVAEHAAKVPAQTPVAKQTLSQAAQWGGQMADRHADRVAAHLGVNRQQAHAILSKAITQIAEHALKNGGQASGTIRVGGKQLNVGVKQKQPGAPAPAPASKPAAASSPTGGAPPRPPNPASEGSRPPTAPKRGLAGRALDHALRHLGTPAEKRLARKRIASRSVGKAMPIDDAELDAIADAEELELEPEERESLLKAMASANTRAGSAGGILTQGDAASRRKKRAAECVAKALANLGG